MEKKIHCYLELTELFLDPKFESENQSMGTPGWSSHHSSLSSAEEKWKVTGFKRQAKNMGEKLELTGKKVKEAHFLILVGKREMWSLMDSKSSSLWRTPTHRWWEGMSGESKGKWQHSGLLGAGRLSPWEAAPDSGGCYTPEPEAPEAGLGN